MENVFQTGSGRVKCAVFALMCMGSLIFAAPKDSFAAWWNASTQSYPAGKQFVTPESWKAGQYVVTGTTVNGKRDSVAKMLIVREEQDGWVVEFVNIDKKGKETASQMLMLGYKTAVKTGDFSGITIGWMKMKDEKGNIQTIEGDQMAMFNAFTKQTYEKMLVNIPAATAGGPLTVPAGSFADTSYYKASVKIMGFNVETETWYNSAVPVNGVVKTQTADGKTVSELLSFGSDGKPTIN